MFFSSLSSLPPRNHVAQCLTICLSAFIRICIHVITFSQLKAPKWQRKKHRNYANCIEQFNKTSSASGGHVICSRRELIHRCGLERLLMSIRVNRNREWDGFSPAHTPKAKAKVCQAVMETRKRRTPQKRAVNGTAVD
jgi:hypothetical protein